MKKARNDNLTGRFAKRDQMKQKEQFLASPSCTPPHALSCSWQNLAVGGLLHCILERRQPWRYEAYIGTS